MIRLRSVRTRAGKPVKRAKKSEQNRAGAALKPGAARGPSLVHRPISFHWSLILRGSIVMSAFDRTCSRPRPVFPSPNVCSSEFTRPRRDPLSPPVLPIEASGRGPKIDIDRCRALTPTGTLSGQSKGTSHLDVSYRTKNSTHEVLFLTPLRRGARTRASLQPPAESKADPYPAAAHLPGRTKGNARLPLIKTALSFPRLRAKA